MSKVIDIAVDFSPVPSGRFPEDGDFNGELFREKLLVPILRANEVVDVILDNTEGYGTSFLEEAFGGLVREHAYSKEFLQKHLHLVAKSRVAMRYKKVAEDFIAAATPRAGLAR